MTISVSPTVASHLNATVPSERIGDQIVRVRAGELELTMHTDFLAGVFQVSKQNQITDRNTVVTAEGEFPVFVLQELLNEKLGLATGEINGKALLAINSDNGTRMILVDSVSRPSKIKAEHIHPMPKLGFSTDHDGLIRSVINIDPEADDPDRSIRLLFDPRVAVGQSIPPEPEDAPNPMPKEAASAIAVAVAAKLGDRKTTGQSGQLLAFIPEDIPAGEVEHVFCLPLNAIAEVVTVQPNIDRTGANEFLEGFALWRTIPVPIVRLGKVFGFHADEQPDEGRRLLVARTTGNRFIGFYTKPQMQTMKVPVSVPGNAEPFDGCPHLGCFRTELGELVVPNLNRILASDF